jgi:hypothetical protein
MRVAWSPAKEIQFHQIEAQDIWIQRHINNKNSP